MEHRWFQLWCESLLKQKRNLGIRQVPQDVLLECSRGSLTRIYVM
jgi:hypothetical protein